jgi:hypothetical protein
LKYDEAIQAQSAAVATDTTAGNTSRARHQKYIETSQTTAVKDQSKPSIMAASPQNPH